MKRLAAALLTVAALALALAATASADAVGDAAKACADISSGTAGYTGSNPDPELGEPANVVVATVNYDAPTCRGVFYAVLVFDASGTTLLGYQIQMGNGTSSLNFQINDVVGTYNADGTQSVCLVTLSFQGPRIYDRAPDSGCGLVTSGGSGAGGGTFG